MSYVSTTLRIPPGLKAVIEGASQESKQTGEIPELSQSEIQRLLLWDSAENLIDGEISSEAIELEEIDLDPETLSELIPKKQLAKFYREERESDGWYLDMKHDIEGRARDQLGKRFKRGYSPEAIEQRAKTFIGEAWDYWGKIEGQPDRAKEEAEKVRQIVRDLQEQYETLDFDPHEEWLLSIEDELTDDEQEQRGIAIDELNYQILEDARERILEPSSDRIAIQTTLQNEHGISSVAAETAIKLVQPQSVEEIHEEHGIDPQASESDNTPEDTDSIDLTDSGMISGEDAGELIDHSEPGQVDPDEELIEEAIELKQEKGMPWDVIPEALSTTSERRALAAKEIAANRLVSAKQGGVSADD